MRFGIAPLCLQREAVVPFVQILKLKIIISPLLGLPSPSVRECSREILPAVEYPLDEHCIRRDDESNGDAALKSDGAQTGPYIVTFRPAQRKGRKPFAAIDYTTDICVWPLFTGIRRDMFVRLVDVALSQRREYDVHKSHGPFLAA